MNILKAEKKVKGMYFLFYKNGPYFAQFSVLFSLLFSFVYDYFLPILSSRTIH